MTKEEAKIILKEMFSKKDNGIEVDLMLDFEDDGQPYFREKLIEEVE